MSKKVLDALKSRFGPAVLDCHSACGDDTAVIAREKLVEVCRWLNEAPEAAFDQPIDVTCVDYSEWAGEGKPATRFVVVYHLRSTSLGHRVRLRVPVPDDDLHVPTVTSIWKGLSWFEREVYDMFGVVFDGHPDLRRILLYPEFVGHPLRKDYPRRGYQPTIEMPGLSGDPVPGAGARRQKE